MHQLMTKGDIEMEKSIILFERRIKELEEGLHKTEQMWREQKKRADALQDRLMMVEKYFVVED
jgi:hypothetical protein